MRRGISIIVLSLGAWTSPSWAEDTPSVATGSEGPGAVVVLSASRSAPLLSPATTKALKEEAYFSFFIEDYLTSATRLKLLEQRIQDERDTLNDVRLLRGSLYLAWGMHRPARVLFDQLVEAFPPGHDRNQVLLLIERLQYSRSLYQAAVSTFKRLDRDPAFGSMDQAAYLAGMSHYALGNFNDALGVLGTVPNASAYGPFAKLASAKSQMKLADVAGAVRHLEELGAVGPHDDAERQALAEKSRVTLGLLLVETGWYNNAIPVFESVPPVSRFYPDALFGSGWAHLYRKQYAESLATFSVLTRAAPDHPYALEALTAIGHSYDRLGARAKALEAYGTALETYRRTLETLDRTRNLIQDRERLSELLTTFTSVMDSPLGPLLDDDGLRFWVKQYGELVALERYLTRKLDDTAVFDVMLDHRGMVFRDRLPVVRQFLDHNPTRPLTQRADELWTTLHHTVQEDTAGAWALGTEAATLDALAEARLRSRAVGAAIRRLDDGRPSARTQRDELLAQWTATDRWLEILHGERVWTITTEIPGRRDDLQRALDRLTNQLDQAERHQRELGESIVGVEDQLDEFRRNVRNIRRDLVVYRTRLIEARTELLPPLQALLAKAVNRRSGHIEAMAAAARLNQIRLWDVASK